MNRHKCITCSRLAKVVPMHLEALVESLDRKREKEKREGEDAEKSTMNNHCTSVAPDGSRTFSF